MKTLGTLLIAMFAAPTFAWTINADFNNGQIGEQAYGEDGFDDAAGLSTYTTDEKLKGQAARLEILSGETGYGKWGGSFRFPESAYKGETIWFSLHTYFPEDFIHYADSAGSRLKFLRIGTLDSSGENQGYNDLYIDMEAVPNFWKWIFEGELSWADIGGDEIAIVKETWEHYEMAVTLDSVSKDEGGLAEVWLWKDGILIANLTDKKTLIDSDSYSNRALLFTYWNGGSPQTQHMYVDEITITNEQPTTVDSYGNPFIPSVNSNRPLPSDVVKEFADN